MWNLTFYGSIIIISFYRPNPNTPGALLMLLQNRDANRYHENTHVSDISGCIRLAYDGRNFDQEEMLSKVIIGL